MKKILLKFLMLFMLTATLSAVDLSFRISPAYTFAVPDSKDSTKTTFDPGFTGFFQTDVNFFNIASAGIEFGFNPQSISGYKYPFNCFNFGLGVGAYYYPVSRLYVGAGGSFGFYVGQLTTTDETGEKTDTTSNMDFYLRAYGEAGFRFNPNLTLNAFGGIISYTAHKGSVSRGNINNRLYAGASLRVDVSTGKKSTSAFNVQFEQVGPVIPSYTSLYRQNAFGSVKIRNGETAEIRNVRISFNGGKYTSSTLVCKEIALLRRGAVIEVPLLADFSNELLNFSEDGKFSGDVIIEYNLLGKKKTYVHTIVVSVANKNTFYWDDPDALAAFISSDTNEVLELAKVIAGIARDNLYTGMNRNIQFAAAMLEGLRLSGITYSEDKITPFMEYHLTSDRDLIQFPLETMNCLSGDYDDIGILYASCLESIGVKTAVVYTDSDFYVLASLGIIPEQAQNHFSDTNDVICIDDEVYLILAMSQFEKGFTACRKEGASADVSEGVLVVTSDAWQLYPPVAYTGKGSTFEKPAKEELLNAVSASLKDYINDELLPIINQLKISGTPNQLGVAYVRAGKYEEALSQFQKAAATGNVAAMNNLANVYSTLKRYDAASAQYQKVLKINPDNESALRGYEAASMKLEE